MRSATIGRLSRRRPIVTGRGVARILGMVLAAIAVCGVDSPHDVMATDRLRVGFQVKGSDVAAWRAHVNIATVSPRRPVPLGSLHAAAYLRGIPGSAAQFRVAG